MQRTEHMLHLLKKVRVIRQICFAFICLHVGHRVCESHTELHANEQIPQLLVCCQRYTCLSYIDSRHVTEEPLVLGGVLWGPGAANLSANEV